jgi:hypothetical protein
MNGGVLALENASSLEPVKLALFPMNPHPWTPTRVAGGR